MSRLLFVVSLITTAVMAAVARQAPAEALSGFTRDGAVRQRSLERRFLALPSPDRIRQAHRLLAGEPHMAGTARDRELAAWTRDRFSEYGLEQVEITTHE